MAASSSTAASANIMLAIFEKKTNSIDLYRPLRNYVAFHYSEREAQHIEDVQNALFKWPKVHLYVLDAIIKHVKA